MRPRLRALFAVPALLLLAVACGDTSHATLLDAGAGDPDATLQRIPAGADPGRSIKRTTKMHAGVRHTQATPEADVPAALRMAVLRQRQTSPGYDFAVGATGAFTSHAGARGGGDRVEATPTGIRVSNEAASAPATRLSLGVETVSVGRAGHPQSLGVTEEHVLGQELVLTRDDAVEERFMAGPLGVEQSYEIDRKPAGSGPLVIEVAFDGLAPTKVPGPRDRVMLSDIDGRSRGGYRGLVAVDATKQELAAHMEVHGQDVQLVVDDAAATYPVSVDPVVWTQQQELTASDAAAGDAFGTSVAISGTLAIVGAPNHTVGASTEAGAAYVFTQSGTLWTLQQELTASDRAAFDAFGTSVAITGGTPLANGASPSESPGIVVVGSPFHTVGAHPEAGAAYVFVQSGTTWTLQQELTAGDGADFDGFGTSVSVSGTTAFVGGPYHAVSGHSEAGAAYMFTQSGTTWTAQQELTASDAAVADLFGYSVSVSGVYAIVGAYQHDVGAIESAGAAYVFGFTSPTWVQRQELTASDAAIADFYGFSVHVSGGATFTGATAIIGAYQHNVGANVSAGTAYVVSTPAGSASPWALEQELTAADGAAGDWFGFAVAIDANTIASGAPNHAVGGKAGAGVTYGYTESGTTWTLAQELSASDGAANDEFGNAVSTSNDLVLSGAPSHAVGASAGAGAAYVFDGTLADGANCYIGDAILPNLTVNSADACQVCDISVSPDAWSSAPASAVAPPNGTSCTFGTSGAGVCNDGTCEAGCFIAGAFFAPGTVNPANACELCTPATSTTAWSNEAAGTSCGASGCTTAGTCAGGACVGATPTCTASDQCHSVGVCNTTTGVCSNPPDPDGTTCNDGNACTQTDACQAGVCTGSNPVTCVASDPCHAVGTCDPASGVCSNPPDPDGTTCNDGNACTQTDTCQAGVCAGSNPVVCMPSDPCHAAGACDPTSGVCSNPSDPDGTACNDGNACTQMDTCQAGVCGGQAVVCTAEDECHTAGTCSAASGACTNPTKPNGTVCSVGLCESGVCTPAVGMSDAGHDGSASDGGHQDGSTTPDGGRPTDAGLADGGDSGMHEDGAADATHPKDGEGEDARSDGKHDASDAGEHHDAGEPHDASEHHDASEESGAGQHRDAGEHHDAAPADASGDSGETLVASGDGCSCRVTTTESRTGPETLALGLIPFIFAARRRRRTVSA